jgi:hypothetical protein
VTSTSDDFHRELPPDPDLDDLPDEIEQVEGRSTPFDWDRETGERGEGPIERIDIARGLANRRRLAGGRAGVAVLVLDATRQ